VDSKRVSPEIIMHVIAVPTRLTHITLKLMQIFLSKQRKGSTNFAGFLSVSGWTVTPSSRSHQPRVYMPPASDPTPTRLLQGKQTEDRDITFRTKCITRAGTDRGGGISVLASGLKLTHFLFTIEL
jgi:hypothetical protein